MKENDELEHFFLCDGECGKKSRMETVKFSSFLLSLNDISTVRNLVEDKTKTLNRFAAESWIWKVSEHEQNKENSSVVRVRSEKIETCKKL